MSQYMSGGLLGAWCCRLAHRCSSGDAYQVLLGRRTPQGLERAFGEMGSSSPGSGMTAMPHALLRLSLWPGAFATVWPLLPVYLAPAAASCLPSERDCSKHPLPMTPYNTLVNLSTLG